MVYVKKADYTWILLGMFLGLLSHLSRAYRWLFQLEPMGYKVKFGNSVMAVFATYLINYTIPRAGEVARASILTNYEDVPFEKAFGNCSRTYCRLNCDVGHYWDYSFSSI